MIFMTQEKQDLIELKIHYDNLKKQQDALVKEREKLLKEQNQLLNRGLSKFFLFRFVQVITRPVFQFIKGVLGMPPNDREIQLDAIASKGDIISESLKNVESQIKAINKQQLKDRSFDTITDNDLTEYRNNVVLKETEINKIRVESQKNPSMILKEFSQIKGWDEPINKHKVLDFVLEKKDFIDKFAEYTLPQRYFGKVGVVFVDIDYVSARTALFAEQIVSSFHFGNRPVQALYHLIRIGKHFVDDKVRQTFVYYEFRLFRVD